MIEEHHPYYFLSALSNKADEFNFSKYVYQPDSLFDERECFKLSGADFSEQRITQELDSLLPDQEIAVHSNVKVKGRTFHIPMIDFSARDHSAIAAIVDRMHQYLPKPIMLNMAIFSSGRSFHAYSTSLLTPKQWHEFMGRLLLINPPGSIEFVDTRWIGHRLIGGYGSLRWSNNSGRYLGIPQRIVFP